MDATVFAQGRGVWHVNASPTMRSLGDLLMEPDRSLTILADEGSPLCGISPGPLCCPEHRHGRHCYPPWRALRTSQASMALNQYGAKATLLSSEVVTFDKGDGAAIKPDCCARRRRP